MYKRQILDYALCSAPGAPLKQALVDRGIGKDVYSIYENGIRQPYFSVVAKDTSVEKEQEFLQVTKEVLEKLAAEGFDEKALLAGINYYEFKYREADFVVIDTSKQCLLVEAFRCQLLEYFFRYL